MRTPAFLMATAIVAATAPAAAQDGGSDLAQQLSNPVASLIQVPFQNNFDFGSGPDGDGFRYTLNVQPVIPIAVNDDWNMISRTIVPIISQHDVTAPGVSQFGLGDTVQSLFFSPKSPTASGVVWGVGPAFMLPTATNRALGNGKWGVGPTGVILKIAGKLTYGALGNHIWSIAGKDDRSDVSASFVQPFISYTNASATTYGVNSEISYDWLGNNWVVPINLSVSQLMKFGKQPVSLGGGVKYFVVSPTGGSDWGLRLNLTFVFPG